MSLCCGEASCGVELKTHAQHTASSVVLSRSVLLRRLGSSFSPEAGALFADARATNIFLPARSGQQLSIKKCVRIGEFHHAKVSLL
jgi:hypothetical protein